LFTHTAPQDVRCGEVHPVDSWWPVHLPRKQRIVTHVRFTHPTPGYPPRYIHRIETFTVRISGPTGGVGCLHLILGRNVTPVPFCTSTVTVASGCVGAFRATIQTHTHVFPVAARSCDQHGVTVRVPVDQIDHGRGQINQINQNNQINHIDNVEQSVSD
jgi:hypothetical protein